MKPYRAILLLFLTLLLSGCASSAAPAVEPSRAVAQAPAASPQAGLTISLPDPTAGLAAQSAYRVYFQQDISGKVDGEPFERHTRLELARSGQQVDYLQGIRGSDSPPAYTRVMQIGQALYRWQAQDQPCQGSLGQPEPGEIVEPARYLLPVTQAAAAGKQIVNGVPALGYRFDRSGLATGEDGLSAAGEIWLAETGGYVLKYSLTVSAAGLTQTWSYEFTPLASGEPLALPPGCMEVPLDLPVMADARDLAHASGWLSYTTAASALDTANLYLQKLAEQGWTSHRQALTAAPALPFAAAFTRADRHLSVIIDAGPDSRLEVSLFVSSAPEPDAAPGPEPTPAGPEPTIDPAASGLPEDIPLYPGGSGLIQVEGSLTFDSGDPAQAVAEFYSQGMAASGWTLQNQFDAGGTFVQTWTKAGRTVTITAGPNDGASYIMITGL